MKERVQTFATNVRKVMYEDIKNHQGKVFLQSLRDAEEIRQEVIENTEFLLTNNQPITRELIVLNEDDNLPNKSKAMLRIISANEVMGDWDFQQNTFTGKFEAFDNEFDLLQTAIQSNADDVELKKLANNLYATATNQMQENESQYGALKSKVDDLWREFDRFVEPSNVPVQKKEVVHTTVLKKVVEFVENNADQIKIAKTNYHQNLQSKSAQAKSAQDLQSKSAQEERDDAVMKAENEFTTQLTTMLNIPEDKKDEVLASQKYKHFMNLCYALRNRRVYELETKSWEEKFYSDYAKQNRKQNYDLLSTPQHQRDIQESIIEWLKFGNSIKEFFLAIWKALCELVDYFGLLPETMQVSTLKESSRDWTKFVAERGSEVVKEHKLFPLK